MARYLTCPLCAFEFEKDDTLCVHGCPLGKLCGLVRCPSCAYEFPEISRRISWFRRLVTRGASRAVPLPDHVRTVRELTRGERATVVCLGSGTPSRHGALSAFGVVPGAEVTLLQQRPSCVVRVGETELALDPEIAREIVVEPADADASSHC